MGKLGHMTINENIWPNKGKYGQIKANMCGPPRVRDRLIDSVWHWLNQV